MGLALAILLCVGAVAGGVMAYRTREARRAPPAVTVPTSVVVPATAAGEDCLRPGPAPALPDGGAVSAADMKLQQDVIQSFVLRLEDYQTCVEEKIVKAPASVDIAQKRAWRAEGNSAIDQAHALADGFAAQLRIFKAKP